MITFLKIDYWVQSLFLLMMMVTIPFIFIPMMLLIIFGAWQVISGIMTALLFKKLNRNKYLLIAGTYLLFLTLMAFLGDMGSILYLVYWIFIPFCIGVWYYRMICKDYKKICIPKIVKSNTLEMNSPMEKEVKVLLK